MNQKPPRGDISIYHSSHPSSLAFALIGPSCFFFTAVVPMALALLVLFSSSAGAPKESQKSLRSGSNVVDPPVLDREPVEATTPSSMNLFSCSAAPLVLLVMFCATDAAVSRAWVDRSAEAIWIGKCTLVSHCEICDMGWDRVG